MRHPPAQISEPRKLIKEVSIDEGLNDCNENQLLNRSDSVAGIHALPKYVERFPRNGAPGGRREEDRDYCYIAFPSIIFAAFARRAKNRRGIQRRICLARSRIQESGRIFE